MTHTATPLLPRSFSARVLGLPTPTRARTALERLIAAAPIAQVAQTAVEQIRRENRVSTSAMHDICVDVFKNAYRAAVADDTLSDAEVEQLAKLRHLLIITKEEIADIERRTILPRYEAAVEQVLEDGRVTAADKEMLAALATALRLQPDTSRNAFLAAASAKLDAVLAESLADHRFTDDETATFHRMAVEFGIEPTLDEPTLRAIERCSVLWRVEQGDFPVIPAPLDLQMGEVCHFQAPTRWLEYRTQTTTTGYYSQGVNVRVLRGVHYRAGASRPHKVTTEGLATVDAGTLYLTNKRVVFAGARDTFALRLTSLLAFDAYDDGFTLERASGKNPHFILDGDAELANVILGAALARS